MEIENKNVSTLCFSFLRLKTCHLSNSLYWHINSQNNNHHFHKLWFEKKIKNLIVKLERNKSKKLIFY